VLYEKEEKITFFCGRTAPVAVLSGGAVAIYCTFFFLPLLRVGFDIRKQIKRNEF
jgi:hypothetical protein